MTMFQVVNIVLTCKINCIVNLNTFSELNCVSYNPARFRAATYKLPDRGCVQVFPNGGLVILGVTSMEQAQFAIAALKIDLIMLGYCNLCCTDLKLCNIVASADVGEQIYLPVLYENERLYNNIMYEPEMFPGLILRAEKFTLTIFSSGKVNVTGCKKFEYLHDAEVYIKNILLLPLH